MKELYEIFTNDSKTNVLLDTLVKELIKIRAREEGLSIPKFVYATVFENVDGYEDLGFDNLSVGRDGVIDTVNTMYWKLFHFLFDNIYINSESLRCNIKPIHLQMIYNKSSIIINKYLSE